MVESHRSHSRGKGPNPGEGSLQTPAEIRNHGMVWVGWTSKPLAPTCPRTLPGMGYPECLWELPAASGGTLLPSLPARTGAVPCGACTPRTHRARPCPRRWDQWRRLCWDPVSSTYKDENSSLGTVLLLHLPHCLLLPAGRLWNHS